MTKKQMRKIADEIYFLNLAHDDPATSSDEKSRAEKRIISITKQIMCLPRGVEILSDIDELVQLKIKNTSN